MVGRFDSAGNLLRFSVANDEWDIWRFSVGSSDEKGITWFLLSRSIIQDNDNSYYHY